MSKSNFTILAIQVRIGALAFLRTERDLAVKLLSGFYGLDEHSIKEIAHDQELSGNIQVIVEATENTGITKFFITPLNENYCKECFELSRDFVKEIVEMGDPFCFLKNKESKKNFI